MSVSPSPTTPRRGPFRLVFAILTLAFLAVVGTREWQANRAAGAAVRAVDARMAGAGDGDVLTLPTRSEIEKLIDRQAVGEPSTAPDGSQKVVYRWPGVFRSYEIRAYYSPGAAPRLVRYESQEAKATIPHD